MVPKKLVGREDEVTYLKKLLDDAILGKGRIVFISGEAGIGKTRLVRELVSYAQDMGVLLMQGRCLYREGADPYLPFLDALREFSSQKGRADEGESLPLTISAGMDMGGREAGPMGLAAMGGDREGKTEEWEEEVPVPEMAEQLKRLDIGRERDRMYETISSMITGIARRRPLLFFLDDLHWADNATLQLLGYTVRSVRDSRVLLVAAYRPEEIGPIEGRPHPLTEALERIGREGMVANLALRRLGPRETRHVLSIILNRTDFPEGFVETIFRQTEGNPFFIEEVVKSLVDQGIIDPSDSQWHRKVDMSSLKIPSSVRAVIIQRVSRLAPVATRTLENASVIGEEFGFDVLRGISELDEEVLVGGLEKLLDARLISEEESTERDKYRFTHAMLREVVYENLSRTRRRMLHRKTAAVIERLHGGKLDDYIYALAYHYSSSGELAKSATYFAEAGNKALNSYALDEAARYYRSALEALERLEASPHNVRLEEEVLASLGNVHYTVGEWDRALEEFREVIKLSEENPNDACRALAHLRTGEIEEKRSDWHGASESFERSLEIFCKKGDIGGQASVHQALSMMLWRKGEYQRALEEGGKGLALVERAGDKYLTAQAMIALGNVYLDMGDFVRSREYYEKGLALAEAVQDPLEIARALNNLGDVEMKNRRYDRALAFLERSTAAARKSGNIRQVGYSLANTGECLARMGDLEKAMEHLDKSITIFEKLDERVMIGNIMMMRGIMYRNTEDWEMARKCFNESTRTIEELNIPYTLGEHFLEYGITCSMQGDRKEARKLINRALHSFEQIGARKYIERARSELKRLDDTERAERDE